MVQGPEESMPGDRNVSTEIDAQASTIGMFMKQQGIYGTVLWSLWSYGRQRRSWQGSVARRGQV